MELEFRDYKYKEKKLSFTIKEKDINGITGNRLEEFIEILRFILLEKKNIYHNKKEINPEEFKSIKRKIAYVSSKIEGSTYPSVVEEMIDFLKENEIYPKNLMKKLKDSLKIVGLDETLLARNYNTLSSSERMCIQISKGLLLNPEILILEEPFKVLDMKSKKKLMMVLRKIKEQYNKTIVIVGTNPEDLYQETDHLIIYKNGNVILEGKTTEVYQKVDVLKKHRIELPEIVEFTYLVRKNKKVKIDYFKDVRDIIKDIYKHV